MLGFVGWQASRAPSSSAVYHMHSTTILFVRWLIRLQFISLPAAASLTLVLPFRDNPPYAALLISPRRLYAHSLWSPINLFRRIFSIFHFAIVVVDIVVVVIFIDKVLHGECEFSETKKKSSIFHSKFISYIDARTRLREWEWERGRGRNESDETAVLSSAIPIPLRKWFLCTKIFKLKTYAFAINSLIDYVCLNVLSHLLFSSVRFQLDGRARHITQRKHSMNRTVNKTMKGKHSGVAAAAMVVEIFYSNDEHCVRLHNGTKENHI